MSISLGNDSQYARQEGDTNWWKWTAYVQCTPPDSLGEIAYVEYHLHPSFRNPVVRVKTSEGGFPLNRIGWGVFELKAKVVFKDKDRKPLFLSHYLEFEGADFDQ